MSFTDDGGYTTSITGTVTSGTFGTSAAVMSGRYVTTTTRKLRGPGTRRRTKVTPESSQGVTPPARPGCHGCNKGWWRYNQ